MNQYEITFRYRLTGSTFTVRVWAMTRQGAITLARQQTSGDYALKSCAEIPRVYAD